MASGCSSVTASAALMPPSAPPSGKESAADQFHSLTTRMLKSRTTEVFCGRFSFCNQRGDRLTITITAEGTIDLRVLPLPSQVDQVYRSTNPRIHALTTAADWFPGAHCDLHAVDYYDVTLMDVMDSVTLCDWTGYDIDLPYALRAWTDDGSVVEQYGFTYQTVQSVAGNSRELTMTSSRGTVMREGRFESRMRMPNRINLPSYSIPRMTLDDFSTLVNSIVGAAPSLPKGICSVIADYATPSCLYIAISTRAGKATASITLFRISLWDVGLNGRLLALRAQRAAAIEG